MTNYGVIPNEIITGDSGITPHYYLALVLAQVSCNLNMSSHAWEVIEEVKGVLYEYARPSHV